MANHFDLNLIPTFIALYEAGSVTAAADKLFVTQPSVSYALNKLRDHFDDPLFLRTRSGMQPTPLAKELYSGFKDIAQRANSVVESARSFAPEHSTRILRLALSDLGEMAMLPPILQRLNVEAPHIELEIISLNIDEVEAWLTDGKVDAAICSRTVPSKVLRSEVLMEERYVCLLDGGHPRIGKAMSLEQFMAEPHVIVTRTSGHGMTEDVLKQMGVERKVRLRIPHFSVLPKIIPQTDLLVILPSRIASMFSSLTDVHPMKHLELPFAVPTFEVVLHWHERSERSTAQQWFFSTLSAAVREAEVNAVVPHDVDTPG